ncbi:MAG: beta-N-acetylhexosaminidase [Kiritimatiellae bacterium]|nr:beta-N-acetylhexosaminidase [Kiritimatiellia bacterium]
MDASLPPEGYRLVVATNGITIASADAAGAFYAKQTLRQLADAGKCGLVFPCVEIVDSPAYCWRGVHFDDCRHFFGKETLKKTLDLMAQHKMNVLHWHLTEDQGWRLEVPGYPELIKYGAVRSSSPKHGARTRRNKDGEVEMDMDGVRYGPFYYTESDVREIVAYAAARHITIVPEIELPGHVCAALAAYPEFACKPKNLARRDPRTVWGVEKDVLCLGNDRAIKFMEDVVDYVCRVFPGPFVHIGGDECPVDRWKECQKCLGRIKKEGLGTVKDLQPWITRHFVRFLARRGKRTVGWDEFLNGDIPCDAVGMNWREHSGGGAGHSYISPSEAVKKGHDMVIATWGYCYFYCGQGLENDPFQYGDSGARVYGGGKLPLAKVYMFDPRSGIPSEFHKRILGGQCCNWSEYTWNEYDLEWKMWPRTCAMAEVLWANPSPRDFKDFSSRMETHRRRLISAGVNCAPLRDSIGK